MSPSKTIQTLSSADQAAAMGNSKQKLNPSFVEAEAEERCHGCNKPFTPKPWSGEILGAPIQFKPTYCPECTDDKESDPKHTTRKKRTLETWAKVCDPFYHDVQIELLPSSCAEALHKELISWHPWKPDTIPQEPRPDKIGLGLIGPSGRGKSMLIHALAKELYLAGHKLEITYGTQLAQQLGTPDKNRQTVERCCKVEILLVDDLDKVKWTERVEADLYHIIETRRRYFRPILVTLNADGESLEEMLTENRAEPIVNRLREQCEFIQVA